MTDASQATPLRKEGPAAVAAPDAAAPARRVKIAVVGRTPPPPGGVGASILSILHALQQHPGAQARHFNWQDMWKLALWRPHYVHLNFSAPWKRLFGTLIGRSVGAKVIHTIHSGYFEANTSVNKVSLAISQGWIVLNTTILNTLSGVVSKHRISLMTPILSAPDLARQELGAEDMALFDRLKGQKIAAAYAHDRVFLNGHEVYGFKFLGDALPHLKQRGISVIFLDTKAKYELAELDPQGAGNLLHVQRSMPFRALCRSIDLYLRPTSTDGNSVAVLEALEEGTPVVASDAVPRPERVELYRFNDVGSFLEVIDRVLAENRNLHGRAGSSSLTSVEEYMGFLKSL